MTILITGATGIVGSQLLRNLSGRDVEVSALTRDTSKAKFPLNVTPIEGDMLDAQIMRKALEGISTLFLLNAVSPTELTEALLTLNLAREAGVQQFVYLSAFNADRYSDVPHFAAKSAVERMIVDTGLPATILRPNCFMQNDVRLEIPLSHHGIYPFPIGSMGVSMVDVRDVADVAAQAVLERERADTLLAGETVNLIGPDVLTGEIIALLWSEVLGKPVRYGGDDLVAFEGVMSAHGPAWMAMDIRLMLARFQRDGMAAAPTEVDVLTRRLGRPLRSYASFSAEVAARWKQM